MSLLDEARDAPTRTYRHYGNGIGFPFTSENHRVHISAEARDALVELADAVSEFFSDTYPTFDTTKRKPVRAALVRLQR